MLSALDTDKTAFVLNETVKTGPVALIFYRDHGCLACNKHLGQIQDSLVLIKK